MRMATITVIFSTFFAAIICGTVLLIQTGGWLAITAAILILCHYFITLSMLVILIAGAKERLDEKKKEKEKNEGMVH